MDDRPALDIRKPWLPALVTLVLMAGLGGWVGWQWRAMEQGARVEQERRFEAEVDYIEYRLQGRMQAYEVVLRSLAGLTAVSGKVTPEDWLKATDQLLLQETYPGIQALNLARWVGAGELETLVARIRERRPDFRVWPENDNPEHVIVEYIHPPLWQNRQALGYDLLAEPARRQALLRARDTGYSTLSGPLRLIQEVEEGGQAGILLFLPLYRPGMPVASLQERQTAFLGVIYGAFRLDDLVAGVLGDRVELFDIQLFDAAEPGMPLLASRLTLDESTYRAERSLYLYGRTWRLLVSGTPRYISGLEGSRLFGLIGGLAAVVLFSLLVGGYLHLRERALASSRTLLEQLREREERFRLLIEQLPVATLLCDRNGQIELANQSAASLLGGTVDELLGHRVSYYLPGLVVQDQRSASYEEITAHRDNGEPLPVTLHVARLDPQHAPHYLFNLVDLRAFKRAEERFRDMVEGLPNAFVLVQGDGRIVMINRQTETLLGYSREELLGQPVERLLPDALAQGHGALREAFMQRPEAHRVGANREVFARHRDGRQIPLEIGLAPLRGDDQLVQAVLIDISHRKAAELRLRDQAEQLAVANRYKTEFLANMSHELRTPLNSILILSDQLRQNAQGALSEKQVRHADIIYRAGSELLQIINDVLDLSRIEAGRLRLALERVDLPALLHEVEDILQPLAEEKHLRLSSRVEPGTPTVIVSDRGRLQQILRNLLSNALKFTERGEVEVVARLSPVRSSGAPPLQLVVRDTGIGIAADQHERIFQAFQQIDGSISRHYGGTGLGLAITRQLVEVLEGRILLESAPGQGSTFTVELPLDLQCEASESASGMLEGRLLVLARDEASAAMIEGVARTHGLSAVRCDDTAQAIDLLRQRRFRAVLMDLDGTGGEGWKLYRELRDDTRHQDTPVLVLGAEADRQHWHDDALHYLSKPLEKEALERLFVRMMHPQGDGRRLLLLDADPTRGACLRERFERAGHAVTLAARGEEARLAFATRDYQALVIDYDLPGGEIPALLDALNRLRPFKKENKVIVHSRGALSEADFPSLQPFISLLPRLDGEDRMDAILRQVEGEPERASEAAGELLLGRKVLLLESDVRSIFVLCGVLDELGLQTTAATSDDEALERFREAAFDLVLLSVEAGGGGALIDRLREEYGCQVPILCLVSAGDEGVPSADECMVKPVRAEALGALIHRWIGREPLDNAG